MKGYKITNANMICRNYQYELNKKFILNNDKPLQLCDNGFHFCEEMKDCFEYYDFYNGERLFEVEALGKTITKGDKTVTDKIIFLREIFLTKEELYIIFSLPKFGNKGKNNIGKYNKGNYNIGSWNKGDYNEGSYNYGDCNTGNNNKGNNNIDNNIDCNKV